MEKSTEELLRILQSKKSYEEFFQEEVGELVFDSLESYLALLLKEKSLKKSEVIIRSNMDKNYAYQLFNGTKKNPSRDKVLMLAFGMRLTLQETRMLLKIAMLPDLYVRVPRDSVILFCLQKGTDLITANEMLHSLSLDILE